MRLDKYLASCYIGSRSEVKKIIKQKKITINGLTIINENYNVDEKNDIVKFNKQVLKYQKYYYFVLNKPSGYVTSTNDPINKTVMELFSDLPPLLIKELFPVGRLDKDTEGLLIVTNDGDFSHKLTSPNSHISKTYYVEYEGILIEEAPTIIATGLKTNKEEFLSGVLDIINNNSCYLTISEGKYHQVKKMIHEIGGILTYLKRVKIGDFMLPNDLAIVKYKQIQPNEIKQGLVN